MTIPRVVAMWLTTLAVAEGAALLLREAGVPPGTGVAMLMTLAIGIIIGRSWPWKRGE